MIYDNFTFCCTDSKPKDFLEHACDIKRPHHVTKQLPTRAGRYATCQAFLNTGDVGLTCDAITVPGLGSRGSYMSCANAPVVYQHWVDHVLLGITPPRFRLVFTPHNISTPPHRLSSGVVNCSRNDTPEFNLRNGQCLLDSDCKLGT
jgi:hypothetical protein